MRTALRASILDRRSLLKGGAAMGAALAAPVVLPGRAWGAGYRNAPGGTVTLGFTVPLSGAYAEEGADQLRGLELAVRHLNGEGDGGMLGTFSSKALKGRGILGRKVAFVSSDTQTRSDTARAAARRMIEEDGAIMITGGSSSGVAIAVQGLCQDLGILFMAGLTHSNDTTGKDCRANGFRHFFNARMSAAALGPVLGRTYGTERRAYHLTADYTWGWSQEASMRSVTEALGWQTADAVRTPLGTADFATFLAPVAASGADVLVLNHYGDDMVASLTQAVEAGLAGRTVNGHEFAIVVPLYSRLMAQGARAAVPGILGSANWHWSLRDEGSKAFVRSFGEAYGFPPSQAAHTCYVQTILYADACERAGSFRPSEVGAALEDFAFDGLGNGPTLYRGADHQCFKDVLVMRGKAEPISKFDLLEVVEITPRAAVEYPPDALGCRLGPFNDGA